MNRGIFICFEGVEGSGKSTQIKHLHHYFSNKGLHVLSSREPGGTSIGNKIRDLVLHEAEPIEPLTEVLLMMAARAQHVRHVLIPAIKTHDLIMSDRYADSSLIYQGFGRGLPIDQINYLNGLATQNIEPRLTFLLDHDPKKTFERIKNRRTFSTDRFEQETLAFHEKIRTAYLNHAQNMKNKYCIIDAGLEETKITNILIQKVNELFESK